MKNLTILSLIAVFVLALSPDWKVELHAQTGGYDETFHGSSIKEENASQ